MNLNSQYVTNRNTRMVNIDTRGKFTGSTTECKFTAKFMETLNISKPTDIYLTSIYIGGYKTGSNYYDTSGIQAFSIKIPEFDTLSIGADASGSYTELNRSIVLPMEGIDLETPPTAAMQTRPFVLGHLSKTAVYISTINPKKIDRLTVTIKDQDGGDIWTMTQGFANPSNVYKRVIMQFTFVTTN